MLYVGKLQSLKPYFPQNLILSFQVLIIHDAVGFLDVIQNVNTVYITSLNAPKES